tara:strand:+ start:330 stop:578 length:249 start_codon:yes stop_codon:yes gene_type:complete
MVSPMTGTPDEPLESVAKAMYERGGKRGPWSHCPDFERNQIYLPEARLAIVATLKAIRPTNKAHMHHNIDALIAKYEGENHD